MDDGKTHTFILQVDIREVACNTRWRARVHVSPHVSYSRPILSVWSVPSISPRSLTRPSLLRSYSFPLLGTTVGRRSARRSRLPLATRGKQSKRPSVESGQPVCPPAAAETRPALVLHMSLFLSSSLSFLVCPSFFVAPLYVSFLRGANCIEGVLTRPLGDH